MCPRIFISAAQKMALAEMPVGLVLIFRYGFATLCFLLLGQLNFKNKFTRKVGGERYKIKPLRLIQREVAEFVF